jgi:hypothetical protein
MSNEIFNNIANTKSEINEKSLNVVCWWWCCCCLLWRGKMMWENYFRKLIFFPRIQERYISINMKWSEEQIAMNIFVLPLQVLCSFSWLLHPFSHSILMKWIWQIEAFQFHLRVDMLIFN